MGARGQREISEEQLSRWRLIEEFERRLERAAGVRKEPRTFSDPRRKLGQKDYLSLLLFGLFNPVVDSMRGLCAASQLQRVGEEICSARVSLGSFSEAQAVVDPALLQRVFAELAAEQQCANFPNRDKRLEPYRAQLLVIDGTLWRALPRMAWAVWRDAHGKERGPRVHVKFNLWGEKTGGGPGSRARCWGRGGVSAEVGGGGG